MGDKPENEAKLEPEKEGATITPKQDVAYSEILRNLSEADLKSLAVVKLIINERDRLLTENSDLKNMNQKYHDSDKENGILKNKLTTFTAFDVISTVTIAIGTLLAGYAYNPFNQLILFSGIVLIIIGIGAKTIKIK